MMKKTVGFIVKAAMIAAIYAVLTLAVSPIGYGSIQFRISEVMILFAAVTPAAIPGLTVGCILANLGSPFGIADILLGSFASLLAALFAYYTRNIRIKNIPWLAPLGAVVFNGLIVSLSIMLASGSDFIYWLSVAEISVCELIPCYVLGIPLWIALEKSGFNRMLSK